MKIKTKEFSAFLEKLRMKGMDPKNKDNSLANNEDNNLPLSKNCESIDSKK
jgi:hypothetical protein